MQPSPVQIRQPGKAGLWIGAILLVVGVFGGFGLIVVGALDLVRGLVDAPSVAIGESEALQLNAQRYELYLFNESGGSLPSADPDVTVEASGGEDVAVGPSTPGADVGGSAFRSIGTFTISEAGTYDVAVDDIAGTSSAVTVRVGKDFNALAESSGVWILAGLVLGATGFIVGLIVLIVTARRRSNARRATQAAWAGYAASAPGYPTMGQPPGWGQPPTSGQPPGWSQPPGGAPPPGTGVPTVPETASPGTTPVPPSGAPPSPEHAEPPSPPRPHGSPPQPEPEPGRASAARDDPGHAPTSGGGGESHLPADAGSSDAGGPRDPFGG